LCFDIIQNKIILEKTRWWIADRPWNVDLHHFKQLLQIFVAARMGNTAFIANQDIANT
jgi:hypothetical protein